MSSQNEAGKRWRRKDGHAAVDPNKSYCRKGYIFRFTRIPSPTETACHSHDRTTRLSERGLASCGLESHWCLPYEFVIRKNDQRCAGASVQANSVCLCNSTRTGIPQKEPVILQCTWREVRLCFCTGIAGSPAETATSRSQTIHNNTTPFILPARIPETPSSILQE